MRFSVAFALTVVLFAACQGTSDSNEGDLASRSLTVNPTSTLEFLNHSDVGVDVLVRDVGLDAESALSLVQARPFSAIDEIQRVLDAGQLTRLVGWLDRNGWVDPPVLDIPSDEAELVLILANEATYEFLRDIVDLHPPVAEAILSARSFASVEAVVAVDGVDDEVFSKLRHAACLYVD